MLDVGNIKKYYAYKRRDFIGIQCIISMIKIGFETIRLYTDILLFRYIFLFMLAMTTEELMIGGPMVHTIIRFLIKTNFNITKIIFEY